MSRTRPLLRAFSFASLYAAALLPATVPTGAWAHDPSAGVPRAWGANTYACQSVPGHMWVGSGGGNTEQGQDGTCVHIGNPHRSPTTGSVNDINHYNSTGQYVGDTEGDVQWSDWGPNDYYSPVDGTRVHNGQSSPGTGPARRISGRN